jgi:myo-inositol catabolism protein IolC
VLVRYNPEGDTAVNGRQTERLAGLTDWLHERGRLFLFELLVPATPGQLDAAGGDQRRYDREVRPGLVVRAIEALQAGAVEPDIWKIEGLDETTACAQVVAAARAGGRDGVVCIVLGRGADEAQVIEWLRVAAAVPGFDGFAVGRTIWEAALGNFIAGKKTRDATMEQIAQRYIETFKAFTGSP